MSPVSVPAPGGNAATFHLLLENLDRCVFLLDDAGRVTEVNSAFRQWLGLRPDEILGRTVFDLWPRAMAETEDADNQRVFQGERIEREECWLRQGRPCRVRLVKIPLRGDTGAIEGLLAIFHEMEMAEERSEAERQASLNLQSLGRMTAGVAHDFNNVLTVLSSGLSLLQDALGSGSPHQELLHMMDTATNQAVALANQLLQHARPNRGEPTRRQPIDFTTLVTEVRDLLAWTIDPRITMEVRGRGTLPPVDASSGQLSQVVMNLCLNACDAMPQGGRLLLETEEVRLKSEHLVLHPDGRPGTFVCLHVTDTGEGMTPEVQAKIFQPFFTTKARGRGTGLGLARVADIVREQGGWIECVSVPGRGTRFDVYLPPTSVPTSPSSDPVLDLSLDAGQETILVAENDVSILRLAQLVLQQHGYNVLLAENGQQAVETYRQEREQISLVLLDEGMPLLSGMETMNELVAINPDVRVLLMSGLCPREEMPQQTRCCLRGFLSKPYHASQLLRAVRKALETRRTGHVSQN